jgi:hypothetical protein
MENVDMSSLTATVGLTQNVLTKAGVALIGNVLIYAGMSNARSTTNAKKVYVNLNGRQDDKND